MCLYVGSAIIALIVVIWANWDIGENLTVLRLIIFLIVSLLPGVQWIAILLSLGILSFSMLEKIWMYINSGKVLIRGRK